jgi:LuxR family maltose regulon positive regulatory protein
LLAAWTETLTEGQDADRAALSEFGCSVAWLSLDGHDNDPSRFWRYLVAAFQRADNRIGQSITARLQSSQPAPDETLLTLLVNDLTQVEGRIGLFLDDYHLISNPAIHTSLAFLLEHAPPSLHLVIAGRSDPPLGLSHWRVKCELNEIRAVDLRFTAEETRQFFQHLLAQPLPESNLRMLAERTEGWPAGMQLAALSLQGLAPIEAAEFVADFNGTNRHVFSYLVEEVFQRQPPLVQKFLLRTALLDRLTAPLCNMVTGIKSWGAAEDAPGTTSGEPDATPNLPLRSQSVLEYLAENNLFLLPLDENGRWFRYHTLFAETLQSWLQQSEPELIPELHRRAGDWYAANDLTEQAIHHALAAAEPEMAADMIEKVADHFLTQGHLNVLLDWLEKLPEALLSSRLPLGLLHAWLLFLHDRWEEASRRVHQAGQEVTALEADNPETQRYHGQWAAIQGAMAAHRQEASSAIAWMEKALEHLPQDETYWRQVAMIGLGLAQLAAGEAASAITTLNQTALICEEAGDIYLAFASWWHQFEGCQAQGHLRRAAECLRRLEFLAERDKGDWLALRENAAVGWGMLAYERNDLETAEQLITNSLPKIWPGGQPRVVLQAYLTLAKLAQAQGDVDGMGEHLNAAEHLVHRFNLTPEKRLVTTVTAQAYLSQGKLPEAYWQLENVGGGPKTTAEYRNEAELLLLVRLYLAEGRADEALAVLGRLLPAAELVGRNGSLIEICLLQALALEKQGRHDRALACLNRALALAEPEEYGRIFINEGRPLTLLLARLTPRSPYATHILGQMAQPAAAELADPLTERELEILSLVSNGASNQAIADQLFISLGTVKGHLNHILGKLDAQNRTEAAARGRELSLIP